MGKFKFVLKFIQQLIISNLFSLRNANIDNLCTAAIHFQQYSSGIFNFTKWNCCHSINASLNDTMKQVMKPQGVFYVTNQKKIEYISPNSLLVIYLPVIYPHPFQLCHYYSFMNNRGQK